MLYNKNYETRIVSEPLKEQGDYSMRYCSILKCDAKHNSHGFCMKHLRRMQRWGSPLGNPKRKNIARRIQLYKYADKRFSVRVVRSNSGCWEWRGQLTEKGYGRFIVEGTVHLAHRFCYERSRGPIPDGLVLDHLCRNPKCVRPSHLEPVTHKVNILRGVGPTAVNASSTHCIRGHPFDSTNTGVYKNYVGARRCLSCAKLRHIWEALRPFCTWAVVCYINELDSVS